MTPPLVTPLVTAIVSTYVAERFLVGCLDSLLGQTIASRLEIIVVDSASPENEAAIALRYKGAHPNIIYLRTDSRESVYQAWNRGARLAKGEYITNANTDDRLAPNALETLVRALQETPEAALAYADVVVSRFANRPFDWNLRDGWIARPNYAPSIMLSGCHMGPQPLWRRSVHSEVGLFDETLTSASDYDFWCRIALRHPLLHVAEVLGSYYDNPNGICNANQQLSANESLAVMARYRNVFPVPTMYATTTPAYVNVAMVTYNRLEFTRHAIEALAASADYPYVLNVVDNASTDGTQQYLTEMQRTGVIRHLSLLPENVGVAKAANLAWTQEPDAAYYLKLDNDIVMTRPGWLRAMVEAVADDSELGAVAYSFEPRSHPVSRRRGRLMRIKNGNLGGACILIPRRTFDQLGYWCEDYGLYGEEDFDYGERIRLAGLLNAYMDDEDAGIHLPAGKAAVIDAQETAKDGVEETLHKSYRADKDKSRRYAAGWLGPVERNLADYGSGHKSLRCESAFADAHRLGQQTSATGPFTKTDVRVIFSALRRRGNRMIARFERLAGSLPALFAQAGPAIRLLRMGRPGVERALNLSRSNAQYHRWLAHDAITSDDRYAMGRLLKALSHKPLISILMPVCDAPEAALRKALESVCRQAYPHWQLCIADDASAQPYVQRVLAEYTAREPRLTVVRREKRGHIVAASNLALAVATGEFIALLDHDDELAEDALLLVAWQINQTPLVDILYSDEDKIDMAGRRFAPDFKPDWNPDLMLAQNACGHLGVFRTSRVRQIGGFRASTDGCQDWDLALRMSEETGPHQIVHLPFVLYHWRTADTSTAGKPSAKGYVAETARSVVAAALDRRGIKAEVLQVPGNHVRVRYAVPNPLPRVSILISGGTGESGASATLLQELRDDCPWPDLEILVPMNGEPEALEKGQLRYLPELINLSPAEQANGMAKAATGTVLIFMHPSLAAPGNDTLMELVSQALRDEIGAVSPKLQTGNRVFEAGLILGLNGPVGAAYRGAFGNDAGVAGRAGLVQDRTVAAEHCLAMRREVFTELGGFSDADFPDGFYALDFCLRLGETNRRVLWTPHAIVQITDVGSIRVGTSNTYTAGFLAMQRQWGRRFLVDSAYNPNLALDRAWPTPALVPRLSKPYRLT